MNEIEIIKKDRKEILRKYRSLQEAYDIAIKENNKLRNKIKEQQGK